MSLRFELRLKESRTGEKARNILNPALSKLNLKMVKTITIFACIKINRDAVLLTERTLKSLIPQ